MELFEGKVQDLLAAAGPPRPGRIRPFPDDSHRAEPPASPQQMPKRVLRRQHCECGACPQCVENAHWEKVFNEKFADPSYYDRRSMRFSSPLSEVAGHIEKRHEPSANMDKRR